MQGDYPSALGCNGQRSAGHVAYGDACREVSEQPQDISEQRSVSARRYSQDEQAAIRGAMSTGGGGTTVAGLSIPGMYPASSLRASTSLTASPL